MRIRWRGLELPSRVVRDEHVLLLSLNRPEARNAVNGPLTLALGTALEEAEHDPEIRAVVLTGAGEASFCAGADLKAIARGESLNPPGTEAWGFAGMVNHPIGKPVIAAVNGAAYGGGTELVLAADLPFLDAGLVRALVQATDGADGAVLVDDEGRDQWLAGCYQHAALAAGLDRLRAERGELAGASLRALASPLTLRRVADPDRLGFDCDTWEDVRHVRRLVADGRGDQRPPRAESEP